MSNESSKSRKLWGAPERSVLVGEGIDIGCGPDPVLPGVMPFDLAQGDANEIARHVHRQFDFVYASHCLEHSATRARRSLPGGEVVDIRLFDQDKVRLKRRYIRPLDQTALPEVLAQIQCIVRKVR